MEIPVADGGFGVPSDAVTQLALQGVSSHSAAARKLTVMIAAQWQWPANTQLRLTTQLGQTPHIIGGTAVTALAAVPYNEIDISSPVQFGSQHSQALVKLVNSEADRTKCNIPGYDVPVGYADKVNDIKAVMGITNGPQALVLNAATLSASSVSVVFMHGGTYQLCYTPDGLFGGTDGSDYKENIVPALITVIGVKSPCLATDGCIEHERWDCAYAYKGENLNANGAYSSGNCQFNFNPDGGRTGWSVTTDVTSKMSWSEKYGADSITAGGSLTSSDPKACRLTVPDTASLDTSVSTQYLAVDATTAATMPPVQAAETDAFTVAACYCPSLNQLTGVGCQTSSAAECCNEYAEFSQQFGIIYYWTIKICDYQNALSCNPPYMRVVPQQKFVLRIECPPGGGCDGTTNNRIKYIEYATKNDKPTWDATNGCQTTPAEPAFVRWPTISDSQALDGGDRVDYKMWQTKQVKINLSLKQRVDLCYCNSNPEVPSNWIRVGMVMTTDAFAFASKSAASGGIDTVQYVGHPGSVSFFGGITSSGDVASPFDSNKYSGQALINIMSYDREMLYGAGSTLRTMEQNGGWDTSMPASFQTDMDGECQKEDYSPTLVTGPISKQAAKQYIAKVDQADETVSTYLTFSGQDKNMEISVVKSGTVAICYCAMVTQQLECEDPNFDLRRAAHRPGPRRRPELDLPD
jgi:hypothetical protein